MGKLIAAGVGLLVLVIAFSMLVGVTVIDPGYTGLKINKVGEDRGVSKENVVSGLVVWFRPTSKIIEVPTFNRRVAWSAAGSGQDEAPGNMALTFQTSDNVQLSVDVALNYTLRKDTLHNWYTEFRTADVDTFTNGFMRDQARNIMNSVGSKYTFDEINGAKKEEFFKTVNKNLAEKVKPWVVIGESSLTPTSAFEPPPNLKKAINLKVESIQTSQKAENDLRTIKAEVEQSVAKARGEAEAMKAKNVSITPQLLELKRLDNEELRIKKWNGQLPSTVLGSGANVMYGMK